MAAEATVAGPVPKRRKKPSPKAKPTKAAAKKSPRKTAGAAKKAEAAPRRRAEDREADALRNEVFGIGILAASLCLMLAIASFSMADVSATGLAAETGRTNNLIGPVGASMADLLLNVLGIAAFLLPVTLAVPGVCFLTGRRISVRLADAIGYPVLVLFSSMAAHLWMAGGTVLGHEAGGLLGAYGAEILRALFGLTGAYILVYSVICLTFVLTTRVSLVGLFGRATAPIARGARSAGSNVGSNAATGVATFRTRFAEWWALQAERRVERREARATEAEERAAEREARRAAAAEAKAERKRLKESAKGKEAEPTPKAEAEAVAEVPAPEPKAKKSRKKGGRKGGAAAPRESGGFSMGALPESEAGFALGGDTAAQPIIQTEAKVEDAEALGVELDDPAIESSGDTVMAPAITSEAAQEVAPIRPVVKQRRLDPEVDQLNIPLPESENHVGYVKPPLHFLDYTDQNKPIDPAFLQGQADRLVEALATFKIDGRVTEIHPGPVVTMYEFEPAPGVRISKIANLADDLAMALKAVKVRIVAPIPGKGVVGFEVPNLTREVVYLKEIIGSQAFRSKKHALPMSLGKDIHGAATVTDLAKMPHLLVAGTTGSGKSVGVNGMITSLLYRLTPDEVRFIMVDPKMLELSIYEGIPHLLLPVVTDSKKASMALKWAVDEMERRYELMKDAGVRDIRGYNRNVEKDRLEAEADVARQRLAQFDGQTESLPTVDANGMPKKLPYIVVVIDEFADLMMVAGKEVEYCVARIAQKARAAGIHLILATQRPSTDVITGVIKANFPTRIAFRVSSGIDSRTILSTNGAENLLGKGDMLFLPPGTSRLDRVHGAFVSEDEIHQIVDFIKAQGGEPDYLDPSILEDPGESKGDDEGDGADTDAMYEECVRTVSRDGRCSTSHLQRRLSLGYNRAARIVDQMERDGLVGPGRGAKPREVYKNIIAELVERWDAA